MTTEQLEKLILSFDAAAITIEELVKSANEIMDTNKKLKAMIDTKAYLNAAQEGIVKNLNEQNILHKSLLYLLDSDKETVKDVITRAAKSKDKEVVAFWQKRLKDEQ